MESGRCPRCATAYQAADVAAYGVLRPRSARAGGPYVVYSCESCRREIRLIPHGQGRYAPPGQPPPPPVPESERRPPWVRGENDAPVRDEPHTVPEPEPQPEPTPEEVPAAAPVRGDVREALALLGVGPEASAEEIGRAFRERSKTCHPDKVAHLDEDFQALAHEKFQRLREAYELLLS